MKNLTGQELLPLLYRHGRTFWDRESGILYFDWTCSGFEVDFTGSLLVGHFHCIPGVRPVKVRDPENPMQEKWTEVTDWPWIAVFVDGAAVPRLEQPMSDTEESVVLYAGEEDGTVHHIRVVKLTEGRISFVGLSGLSCEGELLKPERQERGRIQFIGDSITCGFGSRATEENRNFHAADENGWGSYAAMTARNLGLEEEMICVSGITVARPEAPEPYAMNEIYDDTDKPLQDVLGQKEIEAWDFAGHRPGIIVINLGTNDSTLIQLAKNPRQASDHFAEDYYVFLRHVRQMNGPDAKIVCTLGPIDYYFYDAIRESAARLQKETGDPNIVCFKYTKMIPGSDDIGPCTHPTQKRHEIMARELTEFLRCQFGRN